MINGDFHMHTSFSTDSEASARAMIDGAIEKGLKVICVTDHWDEDFPEKYASPGEKNFCFDISEYFQQLQTLKEEYADRMDIRIGVELGLQPHLGAFCKEMTSSHPFDFVIGSMHLVDGEDPYYGELSRRLGDEEAYRRTFQETLKSLENVDDFDVLGHIDYVVRYGLRQAEEYSYERFRYELDSILKKVIEKEKGIELNTAGFKYGLDFCHPHPDVLRHYRELGGEIITVGSDAHRPEHIAYDFKKAEEILKACGFRYCAQFRARKPAFVKIG